MYRVTYVAEEFILYKNFERLDDAACFAIRRPENTVLEIKHYDFEVKPVGAESESLYDKARQQITSATSVAIAEEK